MRKKEPLKCTGVSGGEKGGGGARFWTVCSCDAYLSKQPTVAQGALRVSESSLACVSQAGCPAAAAAAAARDSNGSLCAH